VLVLRHLSLHDPLLDHHIEAVEIERPVVLRVILCLCRVVLEDIDLSLKLLVE